jgi:hypothetical protein
MTRAALLRMLVLLALSACDSGPLSSSEGPGYGAVGPSGVAAQNRNDLATRDACRERANEMYDKRGRAEIYAPQSSVNTPQSANFVSGVTDRGLAARFDYERTVNECVRNASSGAPSIVSPEPAIAPPASVPHISAPSPARPH